MSGAPTPEEIYRSAAEEGQRRLQAPLVEQVATGFIAGVTVVFGIVALGVVRGLVEPRFGPEIGDLAGGVAFGIGLVFLIVGRSELFSENIFDPIAALAERRPGSRSSAVARLWVITLVTNLVGGVVLVSVLMVEGALPDGGTSVLEIVAEETADKPVVATIARAVLAGALLALLSYMLHSAGSVGARMALALMVGAFVAVGPFDHVVVSVLHLVAGMWLGADVGYGDILVNLGVSAVGNLIGGLVLVSLTHTAQVLGSRTRPPHH